MDAAIFGRVDFRQHHVRPKPADTLQDADSDSQAFAAFGAACSDDSTSTTRFHAGQETVRACALDFGRLICAFHDES